ncbi:hypothetical protein ZWY2020_037749 [Hordeum vulgare]|nr:hypothetical protein ZWY2020_008503 [Hordeum vulgare]KAI4995701.1 hypothetical protein ZWY2020_037749 [Hordeum vulgare]
MAAVMDLQAALPPCVHYTSALTLSSSFVDCAPDVHDLARTPPFVCRRSVVYPPRRIRVALPKPPIKSATSMLHAPVIAFPALVADLLMRRTSEMMSLREASSAQSFVTLAHLGSTSSRRDPMT